MSVCRKVFSDSVFVSRGLRSWVTTIVWAYIIYRPLCGARKKCPNLLRLTQLTRWLAIVSSAWFCILVKVKGRCRLLRHIMMLREFLARTKVYSHLIKLLIYNVKNNLP